MVSYVIIISDLGVVIYTICPDPLVSHTAVVICSRQHMKAASDINTGCNHILGDCMFWISIFLGTSCSVKMLFLFSGFGWFGMGRAQQPVIRFPIYVMLTPKPSPTWIDIPVFFVNGINHDKPLLYIQYNSWIKHGKVIYHYVGSIFCLSVFFGSSSTSENGVYPLNDQLNGDVENSSLELGLPYF